jgi:hypothetical protein
VKERVLMDEHEPVLESCTQCGADIDVSGDFYVERHGNYFCDDDCADTWDTENIDPDLDSEKQDEAD